MGVVVQKDDMHETTVKGNDANELSSNDVVLWLGRRKMKTRLSGMESGQDSDDLFIAVEGVN
jgi:hypothetical protein